MRPVRQLAERFGEPADIALIERGVDLVEHAERRRLHPEDRKEQRRRGERALAARELRERSDALARRPRVDVDAGLVGILARPERRLTAVEQPLEEHAELTIDGLERRAELLRDRGREIVGERAQVGHRLVEVRPLLGEEPVALADLAELDRRERIHRLERQWLAPPPPPVAERRPP